MSSSIISTTEDWHVSNMMFWRVMRRAAEVGAQLARSPQEQEWVEKLARLEETAGTISPDFTVDELFPTVEEVGFWAAVFEEYGEAIYARRIGNQDDQTYQTWTIWAALCLARLLGNEYRIRSGPPAPPGGAEVDTEVGTEHAAWERYCHLQGEVRKLLSEMEELEQQFLVIK